MPTIDYYLIPENTPEARLRFACRLTEKAYLAQTRVNLSVEDEATAHELDDLLWTFHDISFIPHQLMGEKRKAPVTISFGNLLDQPCDMLINLTLSVPAFHNECSRIIEIVPQDETIQTALRKNYRFYKDHQYPIELRDLRKNS